MTNFVIASSVVLALWMALVLYYLHSIVSFVRLKAEATIERTPRQTLYETMVADLGKDFEEDDTTLNKVSINDATPDDWDSVR